MIVYGKNAVREALSGDDPIEKLLIEKGNFDKSLNEIIRLAKQKNVLVSFADKRALTEKAGCPNHQGAVLIKGEFEYSSVEDMLNLAKSKGEKALLVILDGITDPHNLGAILRSAECFGAHGVVISKHRSAVVNGTVIKTSAGAAEHIMVAKVTNINDTIRELKESGVWVYATDFDGDAPSSVDLHGNIAIVIGSEGEGIKRLTKELCDGTLTIPQFGKVNSLNASVATGVTLYECTRQRHSEYQK